VFLNNTLPFWIPQLTRPLTKETKMNDCVTTSPDAKIRSRYYEFRERVAGTTIDERTLLSTDYFNSFNEVVMLLGMVADMPEVIDDIRAWKFRTYEEHFRESGLPFAALAIEAYAEAPADIRNRFESTICELHKTIEEARRMIGPAASPDEQKKFQINAKHYSTFLQSLIEIGSGIVHTADMKIDQSSVDAMF
jgi:hypothetical protein